MFTQPETGFVPTFKSHLDVADDTDAVITVTAVSDQQHIVDWIHCSYDDTPTTSTGSLTVAFAGTAIWKVDLDTAGPHVFEFPGGLYNGTTQNEELVITLAAGGTGFGGQLNARVR